MTELNMNIINKINKMKLTAIIIVFIFLLSCKTSQKSTYQETKNAKVKDNYLASEADGVIEYNKKHKKDNSKTIEKKRLEDEKKLNEINHQKHEPVQKKKKDEGQFNMF